jgi:hypothetical protein
MSAGNKLSIALAAALLALGPAACGDDDSDSGTTGPAAQERSQGDRGEGSQAGTRPGSGERGSNDGKAGSGGSAGSGDGGAEDEGSEDFVPRQHDDSGGGAAQYKVKGGDNSVQEFGSEAPGPERDAAATAVHNFLDARAQEAWEAACSYLASDVRSSLEEFAAKANEAATKQGKEAQLGDTSCAGILAKLTNRAALPELRKEAAQADVGSLRVEGDRAFVVYTGLSGTILAIPVTNEDGSWKVGSLAGTPLN